MGQLLPKLPKSVNRPVDRQAIHMPTYPLDLLARAVCRVCFHPPVANHRASEVPVALEVVSSVEARAQLSLRSYAGHCHPRIDRRKVLPAPAP